MIESTFSGFRSTASLFMEVVFDLLPAEWEYVTSKGKVELSLTICCFKKFFSKQADKLISLIREILYNQPKIK